MLDILPRKGLKKIQNKKCHNKLLQGRAFRWSMTTGTWYLVHGSWHLTMAMAILYSQPPACRKVFTTKTSVLPKVSTGLDSLDWNDIALLSKSSLGLAVWNGLRFALADWSFPAKVAANSAFKEWKCLSMYDYAISATTALKHVKPE